MSDNLQTREQMLMGLSTPASDEALKPCPFCGGKAKIVNIEEGENTGGSCICCTQCLASSNVEFEFKENFVSNWNRRAELAQLRTLLGRSQEENGKLLQRAMKAEAALAQTREECARYKNLSDKTFEQLTIAAEQIVRTEVALDKLRQEKPDA